MTISGKIDLDHEVTELLADMVPLFPANAVRSLQLMIEGATDDWQIRYWSLK